MKWKSLLILVTVLVCPFTTKAAFSSHVPDDYPTIQEALDNAVADEEIVVADGVYYENLVWPALDGIALKSESGNAEDCVVDGSGTGSVLVAALEGMSLVLEGMTFRNGFSEGSMDQAAGIKLNAGEAGGSTALLENVRVMDNQGLGITAFQVSIELSGCLVVGNQVIGVNVLHANLIADGNTVENTSGGGVSVWNGFAAMEGIPLNVQFTNNIVKDNHWGLALVNFYYGGDPLLTSSIERNYFEGNGHPESLFTGGICLWSMGMFPGDSQVFQVKDNNLNNNKGVPPEGTISGGINVVGSKMVGNVTGNYIYGQEGMVAFGIMLGVDQDSDVRVDQNLVRDTVSLSVEPDQYGGGLFIFGDSDSLVTVTNNFLVENQPNGVILGNGPEGHVPEVVFVNNTVANSSEAGILVPAPSALITVTNSVLWANGDDLVNVAATYSNIEDGDPGEGNISADPLFVDPAGGDFHLLQSSPCLDQGSNAAPGLPDIDYDGDPRVINGVVDMGADEYVPNTSTGDDVAVSFTEAQAEVTFDTVSETGQTTVDKHIGYPPEPDGFLLLSEPTHVYDVETSAEFADLVTVCVEYEEPDGPVDETLIRLLHEEGGGYVDRTVLPVDAVNNVVCAEVTDFSEFLPVVTECWDLDEDGYQDEACGGDDCDDTAPNVNPGMAENCTNTIDDDCDDMVDDEDPDCTSPGWAAAATDAEASAGMSGTSGGSKAANWLMVVLMSFGVLFLRRRKSLS